MGLGSKGLKGDRNAKEQIRADKSGAIVNRRNRRWRIRRGRLRPDRIRTRAICELASSSATAGFQSVNTQYRAATELQTDRPRSANLTGNIDCRAGISG
jgi:hypothetical protein